MEVVVKTDNAFKTILNAMEGISEILYQLI